MRELAENIRQEEYYHVSIERSFESFALSHEQRNFLSVFEISLIASSLLRVMLNDSIKMFVKAKVPLLYWAASIGAALAAPFCSDILWTETETVWTTFEIHTTLTLTPSTTSDPSSLSTIPDYAHTESLNPYFSGEDRTSTPRMPPSPPMATDACLHGKSCGDLTFYITATDPFSPSACGTTNNGETELVLALPHSIMDPSDCGKKVTIEYKGISKIGRVVDKCNGCDDQSLDLSIALFREFSNLESGRLFGAAWSIDH